MDYENGLINRVGGTQIPDSIGLLYAAITSFLDFRVNDGEYKVMGLSAYGKPEYAEKIWNLITIKDDIEYPFVIDQLHLDLTGNSCLLYRDSLKDYLGINELRLNNKKTYDDLTSGEFEKYANLAASIQIVAEKMVRHVFSLSIKAYPSKKALYYSGGVALNCAINKSLMRDFGEINIQPSCGDAGGAVGAAFLAHYEFDSSNPSCSSFHSSELNNHKIVKPAQKQIAYLGASVTQESANKAIESKCLKTISVIRLLKRWFPMLQKSYAVAI